MTMRTLSNRWAWHPEPAGKPVLSARRKDKRCPPHGPLLVDAYGGDRYLARCLSCGLIGPERKDSREAKLALDKAARYKG
jgi:hypothetical protein